ncbi:MAG: hypothetical protein AAFV33_12820, partial [Chloroflexota bacterium]
LVKHNVPDDFAIIEETARIEVNTCKPIEIAGRKQDYVNLITVIPQKHHVGFYYMPVYIEESMKATLSEPMAKMLKGKSCFHVKAPLSPAIESEIETLIQAGVTLYEQKGWV